MFSMCLEFGVVKCCLKGTIYRPQNGHTERVIPYNWRPAKCYISLPCNQINIQTSLLTSNETKGSE